MEGVKVKEEEGGIHFDGDGAPFSSSSRVRPMEGLHEMGPPPFLTKTFDMVEDPATDPIVSWSRAKNSFVVWDSHKFSTLLLPRKVDPDRWEFANEGFLGGQRHLLKTIKRRRNVSQYVQHQEGPCVELGHYGIDGEIERLRRDCGLLMTEIVKLRQQQQSSREQVMAMQARLQGTERKQQQMIMFLAKALTNPSFVQSLMHQRGAIRGIDIGRKRRLTASPSEENMKEEVLAAAMGVTQQGDLGTMESNMETLFSAAMDDSDSNSEINEPKEGSIPATSGANMGNADYDINWEQLLAEDLVGEDEDEAAVLGAGLSEDDVKVEPLVERASDWAEDLHDLVSQMGFLGPKP